MQATHVGNTGTELTSAAAPAGAIGTNILEAFAKVNIKDNQNVDIFESAREELYYFASLLSSVENDEFIFNKGGVRAPNNETADITNEEYVFIVPQRISLSHLPATLDITLGVKDDYFNVVNDATLVLDQIEFHVRYVEADKASFTERCKSYQLGSTIATKTDIAYSLPEAIEILKLAISVDNLAQANGAPTNDDLTRLTAIKFKRGSNDEIDAIRTEVLVEYQNQFVPNIRRTGGMKSFGTSTIAGDSPRGVVAVPTLSFIKSQSTEFELDVSGTVQPVIFYIYK